MSGYEDAPATKMLATHCVACGRPLVDAESVTAGIGPVCRRRHGVPKRLADDVRERANKLIYECARLNVTPTQLTACVVELHELGCTKLALRISKRAGRIEITITTTRVEVKSPYNDRFLSVSKRSCDSRRWAGKETGTTFAHYDAYRALECVRDAYGESCLVRMHDRFYGADDVTLDGTVSSLVAHSSARPTTPKPSHFGSPCRLGSGEWGVCVKGSEPKVGSHVKVTTRDGSKSWVARIARIDTRKQYGIICETARTN